MSNLKREIAALDRAGAALRRSGASPAPRPGMPGTRIERPVVVKPDWDRVKRVVAATEDRPWQEQALEVVLAVKDAGKILALRGGKLVKHAQGRWSLASSTHHDPAQPTGHGHLWWCREKDAVTAMDGLRREHSAVADVAYAIMAMARTGARQPMIGGWAIYRDASENRTVQVGVEAPPAGWSPLAPEAT